MVNFKVILPLLAMVLPCNGNMYQEDKEYPDDFIVRSGLRSICDHTYDPIIGTSTRFVIKDIQPGDITLLNDVDAFMKDVHPHIEIPYILLSHLYARHTYRENQLEYLNDPKIIRNGKYALLR